MATKCILSGGGFQDSEGNPLALGYLQFDLSQDCSVSGVGNIASGITIKITLDSNGNVAGSPGQAIWGNDVLQPQPNFYRVTGYTAAGQPAWGPNNQQVTGAAFNLSTWVPNTVISWSPTVGQSLVLENAGTPLSSQTLLNFESLDGSVTITDEGGGALNFKASSGGGGGGVSGKWGGNVIGANAAGCEGNGGSNIENAGLLGMAFAQSTSQPQSLEPPTATLPQYINMQPAALNASSGYIDANTNITTGILTDWLMSAQMVGNIQSRYYFGLTSCAQGSVHSTFYTNTPNTNFIGFRWSAGTDTNIQAMCGTDSSHITLVDTGISAVTSRHTFEFVPASATSVKFYIDGTLVATVSTNVPANTVAMSSICTMDLNNSGSSNGYINWWYVYAVLTA
jgi:hypothetical protein